MRPDEVSARHNAIYGDVVKAAYVVGADKRYTTVPSSGTEDEIIVAEQAVAWFANEARKAHHRALAGESSPLEYQMYRHRMEIPTLAGTTGFWRWTVRRHLRPKPFSKLTPEQRARYAAVFGMLAPEQLSILPPADAPDSAFMPTALTPSPAPIPAPIPSTTPSPPQAPIPPPPPASPPAENAAL
jgi:hypothetical protein